ncbi:MAG: sugar phosphate nucleotidyltransferase [Leptospirales bacterium]|jgi:dTDP-glucose pyrophosphorylase
MKPDFHKALIAPERTIKDGIVLLNDSAMKILLVVDDQNRLLGTVTDGDIRRGILKEVALSRKIEEIMFKEPRALPVREKERALAYMKEFKVTSLPIVDETGVVRDLVMGHAYYNEREFESRANQVFVLAGGKGTRLSPFTNILPKPLIPVGETPIVELIMRKWKSFGFNRFILSLNYKAEMIKAYFGENPENFDLDFVQEKEFLGTAGSLCLVRGKVKETLLVINCDVLLDVDFDDFFRFHKESGDAATMIGVVHQVKIPYGVIEMQNGKLKNMVEKPEHEIVVNAGIYALEPSVLESVADGEFLDMPGLLERCRQKGGKVSVYPVSTEMIDVGHWEQYERANQYIKRGGLT